MEVSLCTNSRNFSTVNHYGGFFKYLKKKLLMIQPHHYRSYAQRNGSAYNRELAHPCLLWHYAQLPDYIISLGVHQQQKDKVNGLI